MNLKKDADIIIDAALRSVMPDEAVAQALKGKCFGSGRLYLVAAGKAAWQMAKAAAGILGDRLQAGVCVTKYGHVQGHIPKILCCEAGHPVPDENSFRGTQAALDLVREVRKEDVIVFLLSGGGSALFEKPFIAGKELSDITSQLLACGADITEMNMIRKRLSAVKGGRFARSCAPAKIYSIVLSDILGDPLDMIASGPAYPDSSTCAQAQAVAEKYGLRLSHRAMELLKVETPKELDNVETVVTGAPPLRLPPPPGQTGGKGLPLVRRGEVDDRGGAAPEGGPAAGGKGVGSNGTAHLQVKMGVAVNKAGEQQLAGAVHHLGIRSGNMGLHLYNFLIFYQDIQFLHTRSGYRRTAMQQCFHRQTLLILQKLGESISYFQRHIQ